MLVDIIPQIGTIFALVAFFAAATFLVLKDHKQTVLKALPDEPTEQHLDRYSKQLFYYRILTVIMFTPVFVALVAVVQLLSLQVQVDVTTQVQINNLELTRDILEEDKRELEARLLDYKVDLETCVNQWQSFVSNNQSQTEDILLEG